MNVWLVAVNTPDSWHDSMEFHATEAGAKDAGKRMLAAYEDEEEEGLSLRVESWLVHEP